MVLLLAAILYLFTASENAYTCYRLGGKRAIKFNSGFDSKTFQLHLLSKGPYADSNLVCKDLFASLNTHL